MLTLKEWLAKYGQEDCACCEYNQPMKAYCLYKGKNYCFKYERYVKDVKRDDEPKLF